MTLNLTQFVIDGIVRLRDPDDAAGAKARERLTLIGPTLGGFLAGAATGGLGYLMAGFSCGFAPAAVLAVLIVLREQRA